MTQPGLFTDLPTAIDRIRLGALLAGTALVLALGGCAAPQKTASPPATTAPTSVKSAHAPPPATVKTAEQDIFVEDDLKHELKPGDNPSAQAKQPANADLWERIRRGFAMPDLQTDLVQNREQWYASRPDYIQRMTERSSKYLYHIVEELERRNMPTELALLPFIESAFNPQAVSSAKAAGMWQFMPQTGKHYDLKQNVFRDDRRDVLESTRAALDYLQKLHGMFGDWHLALAAYNWGEGSVGRAIARNQKAGLPTSYTDLRMPAETRYYVPKLQAVKNIVANPAQYNAQLPPIENHPYFRAVKITRDMDVAVAAQLAEVALDDFKALNPSVNRPVILAAATPRVLLPWDNAAQFQKNLQAQGDRKLASWTAWVVPTLMRVPDAARATGMAEKDFRALNHIPRGMLLKTGATLLVPRSDGMAADVSTQVADSGQMVLTPEMHNVRKTVTARKGDTIAQVAARHKLSARNVARWNGAKPRAKLKPGQAVVIYVSERVRVPPPPRMHLQQTAGYQQQANTLERN